MGRALDCTVERHRTDLPMSVKMVSRCGSRGEGQRSFCKLEQRALAGAEGGDSQGHPVPSLTPSSYPLLAVHSPSQFPSESL